MYAQNQIDWGRRCLALNAHVLQEVLFISKPS